MPVLPLSNADIADRLLSLAQMLTAQKENPFKAKAYRRGARTLRALSQSVEELVRNEDDLTVFPGIGPGIAAAIREIVLTGASRRLEALRAQVSPEIAAISEYPGLDPARVLRIYRKLKISSVEELKTALGAGEISAKLGARMDLHIRQALTASHEILLYDADAIATAAEEFLLNTCRVIRCEATGDYRRRVEIVREISFLIETPDFPAVIAKTQTYGGRAELLSSDDSTALFRHASGIPLRLENSNAKRWGVAMILATGSEAHLRQLQLKKLRGTNATEADVYRKLGFTFIEPELREGRGELELAARGDLPTLVSAKDICGELHAHSTSSDGRNTIEQMAHAARRKGYEYTGITDHSQSLKLAGGLPSEELWKQIRFIDRMNTKLPGIRILKSSEVDILESGALDYPDDLLKELDYTVCSIHSKFSMNKERQTERILRAMDNRFFTILGHATGRLLLKRPGYEIDVERVIAHAKQNGCFFEINSSPDRLDLSAVNARLARDAGVKIAIDTDAHSIRDFDLVRCGIDQARRAGLNSEAVLNTRSWPELEKLFRR